MIVIQSQLPLRADLGRRRLWSILLGKVENPVPFIPGIVGCTVLERWPGGLLREIVLRDGRRVHERVSFEPERRITFQVLDDPDLDLIVNEIGEDEDGRLRFTLHVQVSERGVERSRREAGFLADTERYFAGTLRAIVAAVDRVAAGAAT